ncbi:hypothetical protein CNR22_14785 [Sphingobacteriaceae bacterium]|nr:hypothetical protein CNR22_14785 [Sphingobacteriaceae bacterium]
MKTSKKIETYFTLIEGIHYENQHGGVYAYVQFLAYARELVLALRPLKKVERQIDAIESVSWLFNEYLCAKFTHRQKAIFENKMSELKETFNTIRLSLRSFEFEQTVTSRTHHKQAA